MLLAFKNKKSLCSGCLPAQEYCLKLKTKADLGFIYTNKKVNLGWKRDLWELLREVLIQTHTGPKYCQRQIHLLLYTEKQALVYILVHFKPKSIPN